MSAHASPPATSSLRGRWLLLGRMVWVAVAITVLAIILFSIPSSFEHYQSVCSAASEACSERAVGQPTPEGVRALRDMGLSVRSYALFYVVVEKIFQLVWFAVGAIIFFRRSEDRMALVVSLFLVTFGPVSVIPTAAYTLISSQPAWWLPALSVQIVGKSAARCSSSSFPGDDLHRAGHAGWPSRSSLLIYPAFSFQSCTQSCTLVRPPWRLFHTWCS